MENYIVINGKKAELTPEWCEKLGIEIKNDNPFNRVTRKENYNYIGTNGEVLTTYEDTHPVDNTMFSVANYCTDKKLMKQRALHETLDRLLWRFTYENGWSENLWGNSATDKYKIVCSMKGGQFDFYIKENQYIKAQGVIYFKSFSIAQRAIDEIIKPFMDEHPDFIW